LLLNNRNTCPNYLLQEDSQIMKITDVRLRKVNNPDTRMKALASITFDDSFVVHDLRVIEENNVRIVEMPSKSTVEGEIRGMAHPNNSDMRKHEQEKVMRVYEETEDTVEPAEEEVNEDEEVEE